MGRRRTKIVPPTGVECFEVRITLFIAEDGDTRYGYAIGDPENPVVWPLLHEVLGAIEAGKAKLVYDYFKDQPDDDD
jgi:hypothetical protein